MTPQEFVTLSNILSDEVRQKYPAVKFESKFEDGNGKFFLSNKDETACLGFNTKAFIAEDFKAAVQDSVKYALIAGKVLTDLAGGVR